MRIEETRVPTYITQEVFIADDGQRFNTKENCIEYERLLAIKNKQKVISSAIENLRDFYDDDLMTLYYIKSEEDWNLLVHTVWYNHQDITSYPGPGAYFALELCGGDYDDEYIIRKADIYLEGILNSAKEYYNKMSKIVQDGENHL